MTSTEERNNESGVTPEESSVVPIAERIRRTRWKTRHGDPSNEQSKMDLEEEIRRLEAELAEDSDDEDDDEDDDGDDNDKEDDDEQSDDSTHKTESRERDSGIICLSAVANDRIEPLPPNVLPRNSRRTMRGIDVTNDGGMPSSQKESKKRRRDNASDAASSANTVGDGLRQAVQEMLQNYVPSSRLDRPPFYCRICQHQSTSLSEFQAHRQTELHKEAEKEEKKKTFCKLCRKQLTSLVQMEEHLRSKPHRERMDFVKKKQRGVSENGDRGREDGKKMAKTGGWKSQRRLTGDPGNRQWC